MNHTPVPIEQRFGSVMLVIIGGFGTASIWYTALTTGCYYEKPAVVMPFIMFFGLVWLFFPNIANEDKYGNPSSRSTRFWDMKPLCKVLALLCVAAGFANEALLNAILQSR